MIKKIKLFLKKYLLVFKYRKHLSPEVQIQQRKMFLGYQSLLKNNKNLPSVEDVGFSVFSQFEEDGILLFIFSLLGMKNKTFIEIGADDGVNSNCANLFFHFGWRGLFIDGNQTSIERGKYFYSKYPNPWQYKPKFECAKVTIENINQLIEKNELKGEIGLLSIDIDGNDYWIWKAISIVKPQVVVIETHIEFGKNDIIVPYNPDYSYPGKHPVYHGASPVAMEKLAKKKGYRLIGANELGFNFIFLRNDLLENVIPEVTLDSVLKHPSYFEGLSKFNEISDWEYISE